MSLTTHQREAANAIVNRIEAGKKYTSLTGYAGSGKTFLCGALTRQFTDVYACAPTHKAAWVLHDKIGMDTMTIHSFLGLKLVPDYSGGYKLIPQDDHETLDGTVILDESSMVGMDLWRYIEQTDCQWIFIGDPAQLPPVAQKPAPVLDFDGGHLDNVVRQQQGNPILEVATRIRKGQKPYLTGSAMREGKGVGVTHDSEAFRTSAARLFQDHADDPRHVRILAYRNQVVKAYNREIREAIYGSSDLPRFMEGDWLQLQDSFYDEANVPLAQNSEEVKVLGVDQMNRMSAGGRWRCWELKVKRRNDETVRIPVLHESESDRYAEKRQEYKAKALKAQKDMNAAEQPGERNRLNRKRKGYWKDYYRLDEDFADVRYCFAQTVHKSQGSTFDTAYVDYRDITKCRGAVTEQALAYVAATRPENRLAFLV